MGTHQPNPRGAQEDIRGQVSLERQILEMPGEILLHPWTEHGLFQKKKCIIWKMIGPEPLVMLYFLSFLSVHRGSEIGQSDIRWLI